MIKKQQLKWDIRIPPCDGITQRGFLCWMLGHYLFVELHIQEG